MHVSLLKTFHAGALHCQYLIAISMPAFPADVYTTLPNPGCVAAVMGHSAQAALANTLFHMKVRRSELLELPWV
jgi:hypothetical protein